MQETSLISAAESKGTCIYIYIGTILLGHWCRAVVLNLTWSLALIKPMARIAHLTMITLFPKTIWSVSKFLSGANYIGCKTGASCISYKSGWGQIRGKKVNIATGEMSQAITPFHFFDYFHFFDDFHSPESHQYCRRMVTHWLTDWRASLLERLVTLKSRIPYFSASHLFYSVILFLCTIFL